jgi:hypothetical protein
MKLPLANGKYRRPGKIVSSSLLFSGLAVWFCYIGVFLHYDSTRPRVPNVNSGRVIPQNNHGHVVYLTAEEHGRLTNIVIVAGVLLVTGVVLGTLFAPDSVWKKQPKPWEVRRW